MAVSPINTPTKRERLEPRREPYWHQLAKGRFLGYRKGKRAAGTWIARLGVKSAAIGDDGTMDYETAMEEAIAWCDREERGGNAAYTLQACIDDYRKHLELEKNAKTARDSYNRLTKHLEDSSLLKKDIRKITTLQYRHWRDSMVDTSKDEETVRKQKDSANRVWSMLRAALNLAHQSGIVENNLAWTRVKSFKAVGEPRRLFLTDEQVRRLLDNTTSAFHALCKAAVLTGARYGELRMAKVKDLADGALRLSGKTGERQCYLSKEAEIFFRQQAKDKLPEAPLLASPEGVHWQRTQHTRCMNRAVRAAKLPRETVFYSLRHYHISKAVGAGISLLAIARNTGTSVRMIEQHYGKFLPQDLRSLMDMVELG